MQPDAPRDSRPPSIARPLAYWAGFSVLGLGMALLGPALPSLAKITGSTLGQASILFLARSFGDLVASAFGGRLFDIFPGHRLLGLSLLLLAVGTAFTPLIPLLWLLALLFVLLGVLESMVMVGVNALILWLYQSRAAPYLNTLHFSFGVGALVGPVLFAFFLGRGQGIGPPYWLAAGLIAAMGCLLTALPASPGLNAGGPTGTPRPVFSRLMALFILFFFLYVGAEVGFSSWVFTYATAQGLLPEATAALLTSAFWASLTAGRLLALPLSLHLRPGGILAGGLLGGLLSLVVILAWPWSTAALWLGSIGFGLCLAPVYPAAFLLAQRRIKITGQVAGWFNAGGSVGVMVLPWLIGQLIAPFGPISVIVAVTIDLVLTILLFLLVLNRPAIPGHFSRPIAF